MRRKVKARKSVSPDFVYNSEKLEKFINCIMLSGKKETARKVVYGAFDEIKKKGDKIKNNGKKRQNKISKLKT